MYDTWRNWNPSTGIGLERIVHVPVPTAAAEELVEEEKDDEDENGDDTLISVNKLFEDYIYAYIEYNLLSSKLGAQEYIIARLRKKSMALLRNAKIRMSNIHPGRLLMNLRGKDKWIK